MPVRQCSWEREWQVFTMSALSQMNVGKGLGLLLRANPCIMLIRWVTESVFCTRRRQGTACIAKLDLKNTAKLEPTFGGRKQTGTDSLLYMLSTARNPHLSFRYGTGL